LIVALRAFDTDPFHGVDRVASRGKPAGDVEITRGVSCGDGVIGIGAANQNRVITQATGERIGTAPAIEQVVIGSAIERIIASAADEGVVASAAEQSRVGGEIVSAVAAVEDDLDRALDARLGL
jgi:hypothetical protein